MSTVPVIKPEANTPPPAKPRRRLHLRAIFLVLVTAALVCLLSPPTFRAGVHLAITAYARYHGVDLSIGNLQGSIYEPLSFYDVKLSLFTPSHTAATVAIDRADVDVSTWRLLFGHGAGCLRSVNIDGLRGRIRFQASAGAAPETADARLRWPQKLIPAEIHALHVNLLLRQDNEFLRFQDLRCTASDREPGVLRVDRIDIHQPWLSKTFTGISGATAMQNSRFSVANLSFAKNLTVTEASTDLNEMADGLLKIDFDLAAFDGSIRGELKSTSASLHSLLEANGVLKQISVPQLAAFFNFTGESGGVINEGKFTLLGSPRDLSKATVSARIEATDFRLGKRQWNSLVGGITMVENRLQIHELHLKQAHNELSLDGEMDLPKPGVEWWQSGFSFAISATVNNLTELSALFGPDFADMSGKAGINGSIKGANQSFSGALTVTGSNLTYRTAPLDTLNASVNLNGNELQVASFELTSKGDFVRGKGVINILGEEKRYWGELKASVADLSRYSAILQKPIVPQPLAGGLTLDWSGDGVSKAHSGAFHAQLKKFRLISVTEPKAHPLNADLEATYSPGNMFFSKFVIWDNDTNLSAKVTAAPKTLNLQSLHLQHNGAAWLEGEALLPFNVWSAWENASWATLLEFDSPCKLNLTAKNLDLHDVSLLSGRQLPVKGELDMNLTASGTLNDLSASGRLQLKKSQATIGEENPDVIGADADILFDNQDLKIEKSQVRFNAMEFGSGGTIHFKNVRNPDLDLHFTSEKMSFALRDGVSVDAALDLNAQGAWGNALVSGSARLLDLKLSQRLDGTALFAPKSATGISKIQLSHDGNTIFNKWNFDVALVTPQPAKVLWPQQDAAQDSPKYDPPGSMTVDASAQGSDLLLTLSGRADFQNIAASSPHVQWMIDQGTLLLSADGLPAWLACTVSGKAGDENLTGWVYGRENAKASVFLADPALTQEQIASLIVTGVADPVPPGSNIDVTRDAPFELKYRPEPTPSASPSESGTK